MSLIDSMFSDDLIVWLDTYQSLPVINLKTLDWNVSSFCQFELDKFDDHTGEAYKIIGLYTYYICIVLF